MNPKADTDDMRPEYDFSGGVRGKHHKAYREDTNVVRLEPEVARMPEYTVEQLKEDGPPFAMAMLLNCIDRGESFVTYESLRRELEYQMNIDRIFSTHPGEVAGSLMNQILEIDPNAPLINVLVTRGSGIPGQGVGGYLAKRHRNPQLADWDNVPKEMKLQVVDRERKKVFKYKYWASLNQQLFGESALGKLRKPSPREPDHEKDGRGGPAESKEHKKLKSWVAADPSRIGLSQRYGPGIKEYSLMSGDKVDVMFISHDKFRAVEVKSLKSNDDDLKRGIYQCVKYREVKSAEIAPYQADVEAILVVERKLPLGLRERAAVLRVKCKWVSVNTP